MDADGRIHLDVALEVEGDGEAIRGAVYDGASPPREFSGWLELMSAFENACSLARDRAGSC